MAMLDERFWYEEPTETGVLEWEMEQDERPGVAENFTEFGGKLLMPFCFCIVFWLALVGALYIGGVLG